MKPGEVRVGDLYRIGEDLLLAAGVRRPSRAWHLAHAVDATLRAAGSAGIPPQGALHLVHRVEGKVVHTLCEGALYTWHVHDFTRHAQVIENAL